MADAALPLILSGPIIRKTTPKAITFWLVTSQKLTKQDSCQLFLPEWSDSSQDSSSISFELTEEYRQTLAVGRFAFIHLITVIGDFPQNQLIEYDFNFHLAGKNKPLSELCPHLLYAGQKRPNFVISTTIESLVHGSCRNPHHPSKDGLLRVDKLIAASLTSTQSIRPSMLLMTGDQVYVDDVSGPMLNAVYQVINLLGLAEENFEDKNIGHSKQLQTTAQPLYGRKQFLPEIELVTSWFKKQKTPLFSSRFCDNHLLSLAEILAQYFLTWSPTLWQKVQLTLAEPHGLSPALQQRYRNELAQISNFVSGLDKVQRMLAHMPTYMIFDDHDVTDDWNLSAAWEQAVYSNSVGKQAIGNSLIGYWLCQGWGNEPTRFSTELIAKAQKLFNGDELEVDAHQAFINDMYSFDHWHYVIDTEPAVIVLDTRTHRWRSESRLSKPSGLMDWEALSGLQQKLIGKKAIILVSAAPIFGLKLIEAIQHFVTALGFPLAVDAENWMAHPGSGNTILNIFTHTKTPQNFIILSGDVHYSFVYDIRLHFKKSQQSIWQITCSGIKNEFPQTMLTVFDWLNRWLYAPYSPLNWFTKRRALKIEPRQPSNLKHRHSVSQSGIGYLSIDNKGKPTSIKLLTAEGSDISFLAKDIDDEVSQ